MIDKFFRDITEQVYNQTGNSDRNIVLACYNNDFSVSEIVRQERYSAKMSDVFFASYEFDYDKISDSYAPFIDTICKMYRAYINGDFREFMDECDVYSLHREILYSYYMTGVCKRTEAVLLNEVKYEQLRMTEGIGKMLKRLAAVKPVMIVANRFHLATKASLDTVMYLINHPDKNIGILLGANEVAGGQWISDRWFELQQALKDENHLYHFGNSEKERENKSIMLSERQLYSDELFRKLNNCMHMLDYEYAEHYLHDIDRQFTEEKPDISPKMIREILIYYTQANLYCENISKAVEIVNRIRRINGEEETLIGEYYINSLTAICYMYQGKLKDGLKLAEKSLDIARELGDEELVFKSELLTIQVQMAGWHNIFFCVYDVHVDESIIEKLLKRNYLNNLAHIYIYAYDNGPEVVAKAYRSEALLTHFSKGVEIAKKIGNEGLVLSAYEKNTMIASTNGMNEIAMLYLIRTYQYCRRGDIANRARALVGIGYNLSAMGLNDRAEKFYNRSKEFFYTIRHPQDVAEIEYNMALNNIMRGDFRKAQRSLDIAMNTIDKLHMNSLRVCNLSKLYALLALVNILQGNKFGCERNLKNCKQFLNYVIDQNKFAGDTGFVHDYDRCDDDLFLCSFAAAMLEAYNGNLVAAYEYYMEAEGHLANAEGNQFYAYKLFREKKAELLLKLDKRELYEHELELLNNHADLMKTLKESSSLDILREIDDGLYEGECRISRDELNALVKQCASDVNCESSKAQLEFFSTWQNIIEYAENSQQALIYEAMYAFLNNFSNDRAMYIRYSESGPEILFNNTSKSFDKEELRSIRSFVNNYPNGFSASKINESFIEHLDTISFFGANDVCSFVAVPCYNKGRVQAIFITYVLMKDNWHNSINRYMLNNDDLNIYRILFRELNSEYNRIEASIKIHQMNRKLEQSAVTDILTGVYNRTGMYREIDRMQEELDKSGDDNKIALLFFDLDNFKPYNDTYGHDVGDMVLREFARLLEDVTAKSGFVSRYGGDEFIVVIRENDRKALESMADSIIRGIEESHGFKAQIEKKLGYTLEEMKGKELTCSIGIATSSGSERTNINELIKQADDLLYTVKTGKKGTYAFL